MNSGPLRYALRSLARSPGFTAAAVITLALGIGANIAIFSVVYGVLIRPLPYRDADRLALIRTEVDITGEHRPMPVYLSTGDFDTWRRVGGDLFAPAFYSVDVQTLTTQTTGSEVLDTAVVSADFFSTLGGPMAAGRMLEPEDEAQPRIAISTRLAQRLFGSAATAVGRALTLTGHTYTVVGVVAPDFRFPEARVDAWMPAGFMRSINPRCCGFRILARLGAGVSIERARAAADAFARQPTAAGARPAGNPRAVALSLADDLVASMRPALLVLFASVLIVLVVACSNLINLLLARNTVRERDFAVRRALGASAGQLARHLLVENALLALAGTASGLLIAQASLAGLMRAAVRMVPRIDAVHIDAPVLLFAIVLAAVATIGTGMVPAIRAVSIADIRARSSNASPPAASRRLQRAMCVVQVALAMTLVIGATLLARSLVRLLHTDLGVSTDHVVTASLNLAFGVRPTDAQAIARTEQVVNAIASRPGVRAVGAGTSLPPNASRFRITLKREGDAVDYAASAVPSTPGYFSALQMRLLEGRFFTDADDDAHPQVMIMSEDTARRFFGEADPIGRTMKLPRLVNGRTNSTDMTLVGVIANVKYSGLAAPPDDAVYRPLRQQAAPAPFLVVRTSGDPLVFASTLRREIAALDPAIVVSQVTTADQLIADAAAQPQFRTVLFASLAALGLAIAAVGLYSVVAYTVAQRTKEIGIRVALGAAPHDVMGMVLSDGMKVALAGIAAGVAAALALSRVLASLLYGIEPTDPLSFVAAPVGLLALTLAASYLPARRATAVDPMGALRTE